VTTPQASAARAPVNIKTEVKNSSNAAKNATVKSIVLDSTGQAVASVSSSVTLAAGQLDTVSQDTVVTNPKLWSPAAPYLYSVRTEIYDNGVLVDEYSTQFGVRWFSMTAANGFSLNGSRLYLRGFNAHQDHAGWADAVTNYAHYRDMKMLKDCGSNCVRGSHYPHDVAWYGACDRIGLLVFAELHFWGRGGFAGGDEDTTWFAQAYPTVDADRPEFEANLIANFKDMVREARNHPSIFCYSLGNETDMSMNNMVALWQNTRAFWQRLNTISHQEDATRPTTCGWVFFTYTNLSEAERLTFVDFVGMNGGNPGGQQAFPVLTAEYGSCVIMSRPGAYEGCGEPGDQQWRMGKLRWCAFHHGTHCEGNGGNWGHMGVIDYNRLPLRQYYWYRNQWAGAAPPAWPSSGTASKLVLTADKTTILNDGTDDCQLVITVMNASNQRISNSVNGTLQITGPGVLPTGTTWNFSTPDGQQAIEMRSYGSGSITVTASSNNLQSGTVQITVQEPVVSIGNREAPSCAGSKAALSDFSLVTKTGARPAAIVRYALGVAAPCKLTVGSIDGRVISVLDLGMQAAGRHGLAISPSAVGETARSSGMYLVTLKAGSSQTTRLMKFVR
jgi:beta-galactosidase